LCCGGSPACICSNSTGHFLYLLLHACSLSSVTESVHCKHNATNAVLTSMMPPPLSRPSAHCCNVKRGSCYVSLYERLRACGSTMGASWYTIRPGTCVARTHFFGLKAGFCVTSLTPSGHRSPTPHALHRRISVQQYSNLFTANNAQSVWLIRLLGFSDYPVLDPLHCSRYGFFRHPNNSCSLQSGCERPPQRRHPQAPTDSCCCIHQLSCSPQATVAVGAAIG
jgi:hypothetical protein